MVKSNARLHFRHVKTFDYSFQALKEAEQNILGASNELKEVVKESGDTAKNLYDRVDNGYSEITVFILNLLSLMLFFQAFSIT